MRLRRLAIAALTGLALAGCATARSPLRPAPEPAPSPAVPWVAPPGDVPPPAPPPVAPPPELVAQAAHWSLPQLIDVALRRNPETRAAWQAARAAYESLGVQRADYLPKVNVAGAAARGKSASFSRGSGGAVTLYESQRTTYTATLDATWLLYDFGVREAAVEESRQALVAAGYAHNAAIQNVVLTVSSAYYQYLAARAAARAEQSTVTELETGLAAARARHDAGVATIADVLSAQTALSQARLVLETLQGRQAVIRGALATALGLPADLAYDLDEPPDGPAPQATLPAIEQYLARASAERPDLAAARAAAVQADARLKRTAAAAWPTIAFNGSTGRTYYEDVGEHADTYAATLSIRLPVFTGLAQLHGERKARAEREAAQARVESVAQRVALDVWTSYQAVKTAGLRLGTVADLMSSATRSQEVALARYKAGAGSLVELLSAQAALDAARGQSVQARADWHLALAQLAHDTGAMERQLPAAAGGTPQEKQKP